MKKYLVTTLLFVVLAFLIGAPIQPPLAFESTVIQRVLDHSVAVIVYYEVPKDKAAAIIDKLRKAGISSHEVTPSKPFVAPAVGQDKVAVAVIGAGTVLKDGYVVSVAHLLQVKDDSGNLMPRMKAWLVQRDTDHPVELTIVANTDLADKNCPFYNDYAVLRFKEDLKLPGLGIGLTGPAQGQLVMVAGTVDGAAFFARFGYATRFQSFFRRGDEGALHLSQWTDFAFVCIYPGGGGDSGGGVFNQDGELIGVLYCGVDLASETYVFSNPLSMLKNFLDANNLKALYQ